MDKRDEIGFTLVELAVVLLVVAMLIAIAVPTFLGARRRADDRAAQTSIRNVLASAKVVYTDRGTYQDATPLALTLAEPNIRVVEAPEPSTGPNVVSVYSPGSNLWYATAFSKTGTCWALRDATTGSTGTSYASYSPADPSDCHPIDASTNPAVTWRPSWD